VWVCSDGQLAEEQSYQYLTAGEDVKGLLDESLTRHKVITSAISLTVLCLVLPVQ